MKIFSISKNRAFMATVVLPTALASFYYFIISSDVYISEARFVVRSADQQSSSPFGMLLKSTGFSRSQDDSFAVQDHILSRDAMTEIDQKINLRAAYARGDLFNRFPGLDLDDSKENMFRYYKKMVDVQHDPASSITTIVVRAFSAKEAREANTYLLASSERLINRINDRARRDTVAYAAQEVTLAQENAKKAARQLALFRNSNRLIDPEKQASISLQKISKLQEELIGNETQIAQLVLLAKDNPQIPALKERSRTIQNEISNEQSVLSGSQASLSSKSSEFHRLALEKEFADKQLSSAMASMELARNEAQRKQIYLERIVQPSLPDVAMEPKRARGVLATFILGLILWGVLSMLTASIKEHMD